MTKSSGDQPRGRDDSRRSDRHNRSRDDRSRQHGRSRGERGGPRRRDGHRGFDQGTDRNPTRQRDRGDSTTEQAPKHNPADLRSANRPDRGRSPNIDDDVTGRELDKGVQRELGSLDEQNRTWVQKHLVMAGRLMDDDPQLAFQHALAASRRGGRLAVVREAAGMTAYAAGLFSDALREFRTYRRISGDHSHLPEMVDSERALGRVDKALELATEADPKKLPVSSRVELAIVVSAIHLDRQNFPAAVASLEIPELNPRRGFSYSPRLFSAYAQALEAAGRSEEATKWSKLAARAERALGLDVEPEPQILDLGEDDNDVPPVRARDVIPPAESTRDKTASNGSGDR